MSRSVMTNVALCGLALFSTFALLGTYDNSHKKPISL